MATTKTEGLPKVFVAFPWPRSWSEHPAWHTRWMFLFWHGSLPIFRLLEPIQTSQLPFECIEVSSLLFTSGHDTSCQKDPSGSQIHEGNLAGGLSWVNPACCQGSSAWQWPLVRQQRLGERPQNYRYAQLATWVFPGGSVMATSKQKAAHFDAFKWQLWGLYWS